MRFVIQNYYAILCAIPKQSSADLGRERSATVVDIAQRRSGGGGAAVVMKALSQLQTRQIDQTGTNFSRKKRKSRLAVTGHAGSPE